MCILFLLLVRPFLEGLLVVLHFHYSLTDGFSSVKVTPCNTQKRA